MFCCACGAKLTSLTRIGLVCLTCWEKREPKTALKVLFCYGCGKQFEAGPREIGHAACMGYAQPGGRHERTGA